MIEKIIILLVINLVIFYVCRNPLIIILTLMGTSVRPSPPHYDIPSKDMREILLG